MPTTIPFDPSLVLGNLVRQDVLTNLEKMAELQQPIDTAEFELNDKLALKNSIRATIIELGDMGIDTTELAKKGEEVDAAIVKAGVKFATVRLEQEQKLQELRSKILIIHESPESPVDWNRTGILKQPLASDSLKLNCQYFSFEENKQSATNQIRNVKNFVAIAVGDVWSGDLAVNTAKAVSKQITSQIENHDIEGTLVLTATCTHKNAQLIAPFILDVDKAIRVWNATFHDAKDKININDRASFEASKDEEGTDKEKYLSFLSGATFGSSFVGMVHIVRRTATETDQTMESKASSLQTKMDWGGWFARESGQYGTEKTIANDVKNLLSNTNVDSHVSLITTGIIPSIKSNEIETYVNSLKMDPAEMMKSLAMLADATNSEKQTVSSAANASRFGSQMQEMQNGKITTTITGLAEVEKNKDQVLNVQSMMTAFSDFVDKAIAGDIGTPINFYIKRITRAQLCQMWVNKYYPNKYLMLSGDDSAKPASAAPADAPAATDSSSSDSSSNQ